MKVIVLNYCSGEVGLHNITDESVIEQYEDSLCATDLIEEYLCKNFGYPNDCIEYMVTENDSFVVYDNNGNEITRL